MLKVTNEDLPSSVSFRCTVWRTHPHAVDVTLSRIAPGVYAVTGVSESTSEGPKPAVTDIQLPALGDK